MLKQNKSAKEKRRHVVARRCSETRRGGGAAPCASRSPPVDASLMLALANCVGGGVYSGSAAHFRYRTARVACVQRGGQHEPASRNMCGRYDARACEGVSSMMLTTHIKPPAVMYSGLQNRDLERSNSRLYSLLSRLRRRPIVAFVLIINPKMSPSVESHSEPTGR